MLAIQFTGGGVDEVNFHASSSSLATFFAFLVDRSMILICTISEVSVLSQVLLLLLRGSSQVVRTPSLSGMQVFMPIPFVL